MGNYNYMYDKIKLPEYANDSYDPEKAAMLAALLPRVQLAKAGQIVTSSRDKSIIGTRALDTCWGIIFYDRINKFGMVGHALPSSKTATLDAMLGMLGSSPRIIEYSIIPDFRNFEKGYVEEKDEFENYLLNRCPGNIRLIPFQEILDVMFDLNTYSYEFAFETLTGSSVSEYIFYKPDAPKNRNFLR